MSRRRYGPTPLQVQRELDRAQRAAERARKDLLRAQKEAHEQSRAEETHRLNEELTRKVDNYASTLTRALHPTAPLDLDQLKVAPVIPQFEPGDLGEPAPPPQHDTFLPKPASFLGRLLPGAAERHRRLIEQGEAEYGEEMRQHAQREKGREERLARARAKFDAHVESIKERAAKQHSEIDSLKASLAAGSVESIARYFAIVLDRSPYPAEFPKTCRTAYVPDSRQLVIEYTFPSLDVVPQVQEFRYVKSRDEIVETKMPDGTRRKIYAELLAQITLRSIHECIEQDGRWVDTVAFNGHVDGIDRGTGHSVRPCLITVRATAGAFRELDLHNVEPIECLRRLNAGVSKSPAELLPVRPVLEFNMVDPRFIKESDVLSSLDQRPNLMTLTPGEFENLITNLFDKMGLETKLTQASRDGGVDCVAYDPRPILGGKVVIQAKRYKNTVGVSAVRDLFGTMHNEGASKGILVTTSGYGAASFEFASGKPLELIDGSNLLYLLAEHASIEAKIEPPNDWQDPVPDA